MLIERSITVENRTLNVALSTEGSPPLLLLHGVIRRWQDWLPLLPILGARWQTLALDFRGHGLSGRTGEQYLLGDYLQDAVAVVEKLCREPVVIFGHSLGALVALGTAVCLPQQVRAIILEDPPSPHFLAQMKQTPYYPQFQAMHALAGSTSTVAELTRRLADVQLPTPKGLVRFGDLRDATALRFTARCLQMLDPNVLVPVLEGGWLADISLENWAKQVKCPVLLLRGNESFGGMLPKSDAAAWFQGTHDLTQIDLAHAGHLIHYTEPQTTLRLVTGFLESLR
jgi:pimeloyl-ACP methyl ester carboxylesterase